VIRGSDPVSEVGGAARCRNNIDIRHGIRPSALILAALLAIAAGCTENHRQINPDPEAFAWPTTVVADPDGDFVYVISSNFDSECTGGTIIPVNADTLELVSDGAVEIGSFGGESVVTTLPDGRHRIWVPSRDQDTLEFADINRNDGRPYLFCDGSVDDTDDDADDSDAATDDADVAAAGSNALADTGLPGFHSCSGDYRIGLKDFKAYQEDGESYFADNPYGLTAGGWMTLGDGRRVQPIYVVGMVGAAINVFLVDEDGTVEHKAVAGLDEGSHSVLEYMVTDSDRVVWISNQDYNQIVTAHVHIDATGDVTLLVDSLATADLLGSTGDYFRGMARSKVEPVVYAAYRSPPALAVFDITADGSLRYSHLIPLDGSPAVVAVYAPGDGTETVYVTENELDFVYAVDPALMAVTDVIFVGAAPYGMAIAGDRAFVANFEASSVSVFDVDPASADFHVAREIQ